VNLNLQGPPSGIVGGTSVASLTVTAVPEPSTAALVVVGLLVPVVARRAARTN
jgi:PEP-CTERM motif